MNREIRTTLLGVLASVAFMSPSAHGQADAIPFSTSARELLERARGEAHRLGHEYIGTEHLLLALASQSQGTAATALRNLQVDLEELRATIESIVHPGHAAPSAQDTLAYTTRTKAVFALAQESAAAFGQREVGAEHLLIAILREGKGVGGQVLLHHGVFSDALIESIKRMQGDKPVP